MKVTLHLIVFDILKEANFSSLSRVSTEEMYLNRLIILNDCFEPPSERLKQQ